MWEHDSRLDAKPDYGALGPNSDVSSNGPISGPPRGMQAPWAVLAGVLMALAVVCAHSGVAPPGGQQLQQYLPLQGKPAPASPAILSQHEAEKLNLEGSQKQ